jgi:histidyl-tRNA synthetase
MAKVFLPKGTRDYLPATMNRRLAVIDTVRSIQRRYGFEPLETPAFERIETLTGKYGDEGEKLMFRILKRGEGGTRGEVDAALRYDLTVPLARVMAMNPGIPLPFKRAQIQPVWRADRPQRGRFREFYQCDVDTVGSDAPVADAECIAVVHDSLLALGFHDFTIRINHRMILQAMAAGIGALDNETSMLVALDKLDKIGRDGVTAELIRRDFDDEQIARLWGFVDGEEIPDAAPYAAELDHIVSLAEAMGVDPSRVSIDRTLARGLDYYTGAVFETVLNEGNMGSVSGGGRYDGLIGRFGGRDVPAVGVSLGIERLIVIMEERGMLTEATTSTQVWVTVFDQSTLTASLKAASKLRAMGIDTQVSTRVGKLGKQFKEAHNRGVPHALVIGPDDIAKDEVVLKTLATGAQWSGSVDEAVNRILEGDPS